MTNRHKEVLRRIAAEHGTPVLVVEHEKIRENYRAFREGLPDVQVYFALKANAAPEIIKTMYDLGSGFDVASLAEFNVVYENIRDLPETARLDFIRHNVICANTIKPIETLTGLDPYRMMVTFDNGEELKKIQTYAPHATVVLRIRVPNAGSVVELSSKFGVHPQEAIGLVAEAIRLGLSVGGISFHVGSQCSNFDNYSQALDLVASIFEEAEKRNYAIGISDTGGAKRKIIDIGGGFPAPYTPDVPSFPSLAQKLKSELRERFPNGAVHVIAEPGRCMVATACTLVTKIIGKSIREGTTCYYVDDGVYGTFSGQVFDHQHYPLHSFRDGATKPCTTFGPTCDAFDTISLADELPEDLRIGDLLYAENIGAYTNASATSFNGFKPAAIVHLQKDADGSGSFFGDILSPCREQLFLSGKGENTISLRKTPTGIGCSALSRRRQ